MVTNNSVVKIQNLVVNRESRPVLYFCLFLLFFDISSPDMSNSVCFSCICVGLGSLFCVPFYVRLSSIIYINLSIINSEIVSMESKKFCKIPVLWVIQNSVFLVEIETCIKFLVSHLYGILRIAY